MANVLVVDDSPTARSVLSRVLSAADGLHVVGLAGDGHQAVKEAARLRPDVITMDLSMPIMDGMEATREIMIETPTPILIVSSNSRAAEVETAMEALRAGALGLLLKPVGPSSPEFERRSREIVETVRAMSEVKVLRRRRPRVENLPQSDTGESRNWRSDEGWKRSTRSVPQQKQRSSTESDSISVVAIAASTGGPPALASLLADLDPDFPLPVLLVQHIATGFISGFSQWLQRVSPLNVKLAENHEILQPATVYVAPQDRHLGTNGKRICLSHDPPIGGFRPAASHLFREVADAFGSSAIGIMMTGMGNDGVDGLDRLHQKGALTIAQDQATCAVFGMPKAAIEAGVIDRVLPLPQIATHLNELVRSARNVKSPSAKRG